MGRGHSLLPIPHPEWGGAHLTPFGASILAPSALATRRLV